MRQLRLVLLRTYVLGALGGVLIAEIFSLGVVLRDGGWSQLSAVDILITIAWIPVVAWIGGLIGVAEATVTLAAVLLLGPLRRWAPLTILAGGAAGAVGPLWLTYRDGWPRAHGSPGWVAIRAWPPRPAHC